MISFDSKKIQIFFNVCIFIIFFTCFVCLFIFSVKKNQVKDLVLYPVNNFNIEQLNNKKPRKVKDLKIESNLIYNNHESNFVVFKPDASYSNHKAVIVCPGGGYQYLVYKNEGLNVGKWLVQNGYTAFVLFYSMPEKGNPDIPLNDLHNMIKIVRHNAKTWNINPNKVGLMGFSAGGHLVANASNNFDKETRPDFSILLYPVISMDDDLTHQATRYNLTKNDDKLYDKYSIDKHISDRVSPTLIFVASDDNSVSPENSKLYFNILKSKNKDVSLTVFTRGGHGWGWSKRYAYHTELVQKVLGWLNRV